MLKNLPLSATASPTTYVPSTRDTTCSNGKIFPKKHCIDESAKKQTGRYSAWKKDLINDMLAHTHKVVNGSTINREDNNSFSVTDDSEPSTSKRIACKALQQRPCPSELIIKAEISSSNAKQMTTSPSLKYSSQLSPSSHTNGYKQGMHAHD